MRIVPPIGAAGDRSSAGPRLTATESRRDAVRTTACRGQDDRHPEALVSAPRKPTPTLNTGVIAIPEPD